MFRKGHPKPGGESARKLEVKVSYVGSPRRKVKGRIVYSTLHYLLCEGARLELMAMDGVGLSLKRLFFFNGPS